MLHFASQNKLIIAKRFFMKVEHSSINDYFLKLSPEAVDNFFDYPLSKFLTASFSLNLVRLTNICTTC